MLVPHRPNLWVALPLPNLHRDTGVKISKGQILCRKAQQYPFYTFNADSNGAVLADNPRLLSRPSHRIYHHPLPLPNPLPPPNPLPHPMPIPLPMPMPRPIPPPNP